MQVIEIVDNYRMGLMNYYDALELIIEQRSYGASIVAIDDAIKLLKGDETLDEIVTIMDNNDYDENKVFDIQELLEKERLL